MSVAELAKLVGRKGSLPVADMRVDVQVTDARNVYGRTQVLVVPVAGSGEAWVDADRVRMEGES